MSKLGMIKHVSVVTLVAAAIVIAAPVAPAKAEQAGVIALSPVRLAAKSVAGKGEARFDWLAKRSTKAKSDTQPVLASATPVGHGSWVCSPAGFGTKSRCYKR